MPVSDEMVEAGCKAEVDVSAKQRGADYTWPGMYRDYELSRIRDQVRAALEAAERAAWKPIETAPTDGTLVIVYAAPYHDLDGFVTVARYHPDAGWCVDGLLDVTHWRPIPDAP